MTQTLTIRLGGPTMRKLRSKARAVGMTPSELLRSLLERELGAMQGEPSAFELTQRWVGAVHGRGAPRGSNARGELDLWSPDRRG